MIIYYFKDISLVKHFLIVILGDIDRDIKMMMKINHFVVVLNLLSVRENIGILEKKIRIVINFLIICNGNYDIGVSVNERNVVGISIKKSINEEKHVRKSNLSYDSK